MEFLVENWNIIGGYILTGIICLAFPQLPVPVITKIINKIGESIKGKE